ncbi:unnamed protein product [Linum tenue]|uniref:Uncharacterized protein n=1 Tax=Linum tenue TaxID=586396 RepID=A0AAV0MFG5_9ROSI|nr:unnamed protein product [Linum tenue]
MEDKVTSVTWVGGIYRKFEALCMEADDMMRQEAQAFIENHLQSVGANVKQFCSEFVRDVLPESSNESSTEVKQHDLVLKEATDAVAYMNSESAGEEKQLQIQKHDMLPERTDLGEYVSCNNPSVGVTLQTELPSALTVEESYYEEETQLQCEKNSVTSEDPCKSRVSDDLLESHSSSNDVPSSVAAELADSSEDESLHVEHAPCEQIAAGNSTGCCIDGTSSLLSPNGVKLDESCIVVDDDLELYILSSQERKLESSHWSYKKKLKEVLALASKSMKQNRRNTDPAAARSEVREVEEDGNEENSESDWEII